MAIFLSVTGITKPVKYKYLVFLWFRNDFIFLIYLIVMLSFIGSSNVKNLFNWNVAVV